MAAGDFACKRCGRFGCYGVCDPAAVLSGPYEELSAKYLEAVRQIELLAVENRRLHAALDAPNYAFIPFDETEGGTTDDIERLRDLLRGARYWRDKFEATLQRRYEWAICAMKRAAQLEDEVEEHKAAVEALMLENQRLRNACTCHGLDADPADKPWHEVIDELAKLGPSDPREWDDASEWIPVERGIPTRGVSVLIRWRDGEDEHVEVAYVYIDEDAWCVNGLLRRSHDDVTPYVTHWRPLPDKPAWEGDDEQPPPKPDWTRQIDVLWGYESATAQRGPECEECGCHLCVCVEGRDYVYVGEEWCDGCGVSSMDQDLFPIGHDAWLCIDCLEDEEE